MINSIFENILEKENQEEKVAFFMQRTQDHIDRVKSAVYKIAQVHPEYTGVMDIAEVHDASKFEEPEKNRYYLLGEYNRLLGNNDIARKHLVRAHGIDIIASLKKVNAYIILSLLTSFVLLLYVLKKLKDCKILKSICCLSLVTLIAVCSVWMYFLPDIIQRKEQFRSYYDEIITDRIRLCGEQKKD